MSWYRNGTVTVTAGSPTVVGSGTAFVTNVTIGEAFVGPDGRTYEVVNIPSDTELTITPSYTGATAGGQSYAILPARGRIADLVSATSDLLATFGSVRDGIGAGLIPDGNAPTPAIRFSADQDTGLFRVTSNVLGIATGGVARAVVDASGNVGIGTTVPGSYRLNVNKGEQGNLVQFTDGVESTFIVRSESGVLQAGQANALPLALVTNSTERMRITAAGSVGIGTTNPASHLVVSHGGANGIELDAGLGYISTYNRSTNTWTKLSTRASEYTFNLENAVNALNIKGNGSVGIGSETPFARMDVLGATQIFTNTSNTPGGQIYLGNGDFQNTNFWASAPGVGGIIPPGGSGVTAAASLGLFAYGGSANARSLIAWCGLSGTAAAQFSPGGDDTIILGSGSFRWSTIFSATGSINTSDEREKHWRGELSEAELRAAKRIIGELGVYQWNDAVTEKGEDGARLHFGVRAQRAFAIMEDEGLDWSRYAWCCYDQWEESTEAVLDENGEPTDEVRVVREAGDRYGVRPDQLAFWLIAAQAAIQADLDARLAALESA